MFFQALTHGMFSLATQHDLANSYTIFKAQQRSHRFREEFPHIFYTLGLSVYKHRLSASRVDSSAHNN